VRRVVALLCAIGAVSVCSSSAPSALGTVGNRSTGRRVFTTGFETLDDFAGMYISPQTASTSHGLVTAPKHVGRRAHCGSITGPSTPADVDGPNHRGYPTVQLYRLPPGGGFATPAVVDLWVWADVSLRSGEWVSFATLSADASDAWTRVVTVNLDPGGWVNVFHVPDQGQHVTELESHRPFPQKQWVHLKITIDFDPNHGSIRVRQDGKLVAKAKVNGGHGTLEQAHFGMYGAPSLTAGTLCNDDLRITAARV